MFASLIFAAAALAGAIAAVAGFGIGSLLTPLLTIPLGARIAVAAGSIPHVAGTAARFWLLRHAVDRRLLRTFGAASAAGGLAGALVHATASGSVLMIVLGALLLFASVTELSGWKVRVDPRHAWIAGVASGLFGGLVGNQGGLRSAALLAFDERKEAFVATATAIALIVDGVRVPIYLFTVGREIAAAWPLVAVATAGVLAGTLGGWRLLDRLPEPVFRRAVAILIGGLGIFLLAHALEGSDANRQLDSSAMLQMGRSVASHLIRRA
jgi:hypothetical protein